MALKLPRLQSLKTPIVDTQQRPTTWYQRWWQTVAEAIETAFNNIEAALNAAIAAQNSADAAAVSAAAAQADATQAIGDAAAAQADADQGISDAAAAQSTADGAASAASLLAGQTYVTMGVSSDLSAERVLTAGSGISLSDGGAGGSATLALAVQTAHGTYTPTLTNTANLDGSTAYQCQYQRVGNVVTVSGRADVNPTTTGTITMLGISLPIASNFNATNNCGGTAVTADNITEQPAPIFADATNDRATMQWRTTDTTFHSMFFSFTYLVV